MGRITDILIRAGWQRAEEWDGEECGYVGETGVCIRSARWRQSDVAKPVCAQHAKIIDSATPEWERQLRRDKRIF